MAGFSGCLAVSRRVAGPCALAVLLILVLGAADAIACPNCKDAVDTSDPEGLNLARGYFYSNLIMLAMPLMLVSSFGIYVWREMRRQRRLSPGDATPGGGTGLGPLHPSAASPHA